MKSIHEVHQHNVSKFLHEEKLVSDISGTSVSRRSYPFRKERWKWKSLEKTFLSLSGRVRKDLHISFRHPKSKLFRKKKMSLMESNFPNGQVSVSSKWSRDLLPCATPSTSNTSLVKNSKKTTTGFRLFQQWINTWYAEVSLQETKRKKRANQCQGCDKISRRKSNTEVPSSTLSNLSSRWLTTSL